MVVSRTVRHTLEQMGKFVPGWRRDAATTRRRGRLRHGGQGATLDY